jgi:fumarate reductase iron-sulfur subunit
MSSVTDSAPPRAAIPPADAPKRMLHFHVLRHDPQDAVSVPHFDVFELEEAPGMTLFIALNEIREKLDPSLAFDFVCRAGICGSCGMVVNDLSVNTGKWMRGMSERLETWVHSLGQGADLTRIEERMDPELADRIYELDRCIECGCCVAACGTARMREDFVGAVGLNKIARFALDPRDHRNDEDFYELVGNDDGVFGCMTLLGCHDVCPKQLPLQTQIAFLRRKMVKTGL